MTTIKAKVFTKDGNRFLVPGLWYDANGGEKGPKQSEVIMSAMMMSVVLGLEMEKEELEIEIDEKGESQFPHAAIELCSPQLAHGGVTVMCFEGPMYDQVAANGPAVDEMDDI